jgi:hypothetical protein
MYKKVPEKPDKYHSKNKLSMMSLFVLPFYTFLGRGMLGIFLSPWLLNNFFDDKIFK